VKTERDDAQTALNAAPASQSARDALYAKDVQLDAIDRVFVTKPQHDAKVAELLAYEQAQIELWNNMSDIMYRLSVNRYVERRLIGATSPINEDDNDKDDAAYFVYNKRPTTSNSAQRQSYVDGLTSMIPQ
jgi:hypothetical protein